MDRRARFASASGSPCAAGGRTIFSESRGVCPYATAVLEAARSGIEASALVLTTACDQMRYVAALAERGERCPVFLLNLPSTWQTVEVRRLYRDELLRLGRFLERWGGSSPGKGDLARLMLAYDRARSAQALSARGRVSARRFAESLAELRGPLGRRETRNGEPPAGGIPLALVGGPFADGGDAFYDAVERTGRRIVLDASDGGERTLPRPFDPDRTAADPLEELADCYFGAIPDVFRRPNSGFYEWFLGESAAHEVRGIVFRRYVWCDLWHAELQRLKCRSPAPFWKSTPTRTMAPRRSYQGRLEAFLEMLA